ncbi:hypothetical protein CHARACLAT_003487 [Characodon lateralis]|uniref:Uncharacterized protein n=1 Tax=Characodon lateralis TaxID=208331 RepID=A0ABU7CMF3_9TELE|nr:hypothetical protein [Characodon lateralis]
MTAVIKTFYLVWKAVMVAGVALSGLLTRLSPTQVQDFAAGCNVCVSTVATWCNLTGDPLCIHHKEIPPLAAIGERTGTKIIQQVTGKRWKETGQLYFVLYKHSVG